MNWIINIQTFLQLFSQTIGSIIKIIFLTKFSFIGKIKKKESNSNLLILGNGPSLKSDIENNLEIIRKFDLLAVNYFATTDYFSTLKPQYYSIAAPEMFKNNSNPEILKNSKQLFKDIAKKTNWPMTLFIPAIAYKANEWKKIILENKNIDIVYFNNTPINGFKWFKYFLWKNNYGMPRPHNVLIPSLIISINLKYNNIYINGADHSWLKEISVNNQNEALINQKHFYDYNSSTPKPMHKGGKGQRKLHEILEKFYFTFKSYHEINEFANSQDIKIINLTEGSFIDAFKREKFQNI